MIDMIDSNNWERPIYFSITIGNSASSFSYLWDYFQLDGLAYRLVPIKSKSRSGQIGRIDADILYTNLMEKFEYGNMNGENVYMDPNIAMEKIREIRPYAIETKQQENWASKKYCNKSNQS